MNTAQIIRQSLYDIDAVRQDSTTDPFFVQQEFLAWANTGKDKVEKTVRQSKMDFGLVVIQSTDAIFRWAGVTYNPTALKLSTTNHHIQLPPDLLILKRIRCVTTGWEMQRFVALGITYSQFKALETLTGTSAGPIYFDVVGENTLYLANLPNQTLDIEIAYVPRSAPLQLYSTGTITTVQNSASVSGGSTSWIINEVLTNAELIVSGDATVPKIVSQATGGTWVDPSIRYSPVSSIDSDGGLTLAGAWLPSGVVGRGYTLATVPMIPEEHHPAIVDYVAMRAMRKAGSPREQTFNAAFERALVDIKEDTADRQENNPEFVEEFDLYAY